MNKNIEPNNASMIASLWFAEYLQDKIETGKKGGPRPESAVDLAEAIGMDRKTIYDYAHLQRSPKLEVVAKILAYYGEDEIRIPITILGTCLQCARWHCEDIAHLVGSCDYNRTTKNGEEACQHFKSKKIKS